MIAETHAPEPFWATGTKATPRAAKTLPTGGRLKASSDDFMVEEIPAYEPSGEGEHLFVWLEKRDMSAHALVDHLCRTLHIQSRDLGVAGLKDATAVTRQFVSMPRHVEARLEAAELPGKVRVLTHARHGNKLKTGHLRGNRFDIVVRDAAHEDALWRAKNTLRWLEAHGMPNAYGPQRFGHDGRTAREGALLLGLCSGTVPKLGPRGKRLALSACQSALFNVFLMQRQAQNVLYRMLPGDVMQVCATGGPFVSTDVVVDQERMDVHEIVPTGPMFGPKMRKPADDALAFEEQLLNAANLTRAHFSGMGKLMAGTRRPLLVYPTNIAVEPLPETNDAFRVRFCLPSGSYATVLMAEVIGTPLG